MDTTNKSKIDQVLDISVQLVFHKQMVAHLTQVLGELIGPPTKPTEVREVLKTTSGARVRSVHKDAQPKTPSKKAKRAFYETAAQETARKSSKVVEETKRQILQAISQKPKIFSQIKKSVGHSYRVVKRAITELERENKIMTLEVKNKRRGISTAYAPISTTKKT